MYLVVNIGCIECGCPSQIVGCYTDEEVANQIARKCEENFNWRNGGQNSYEVFPLPTPNITHDDFIVSENNPAQSH